MKKYFECNLNEAAPSYLDGKLHGKFRDAVNLIRQRMEKLEEAREISNMNGETFSKYAKIIFDASPEHFDSMPAWNLAEAVGLMWDGNCLPEIRMDFPNSIVLFDTAYATTEEWEMLRHIGIGGSDAEIICGEGKYRTKRELYYDKRGIDPSIADTGKQAIFDRGHFIEGKVIETFCKNTGAISTHETRMFQSKTHPYVTANPDDIIIMPDKSIYVFEAKSTIAENRKAWTDDKVPRQYLYQIAQYPAVLADERIKGTFIGCLFTHDYEINGDYVGSSFQGSRFLARLAERDLDFEEMILRQNTAFVDDYLLAGIEPELSGNGEKDIEVIKKFTGYADPALPVEDMSAFSDDAEEWMKLSQEKAALDAKIKGITERQKNLSVGMIQQLGTTVEGRIPLSDQEYLEIKYAPRRRTVTDLERMESFYPDAYAACVKNDVENTRVFSVKKKKARLHR